MEDEIPFEVPNGWAWCRFQDVATVINGRNQKNVENPHGKYPIYGSGGIMGYANDFICPENCTIIGRKGSINKPMFIAERFWNVDTAFGMCASSILHCKFLYYFCCFFNFTKLDSSTTLPSLTKTNIQQIYFPLPPLSEQKAIVSKIEEIFSQIDILENSKTDLQSTIKHAKSKILDLAIHGKLVPQNPNDEPASKLLEKNHSKCEFGEGKQGKSAEKILHNGHYEKLEDVPFDIPDGWVWCKISDICNVIMGQSPSGENVSANFDEGMEFHQGKIYFTDKFLNVSNVKTNQITKIAPKQSLLLCVRAPVGVINITERDICIGRGLCSLVPKIKMDSLFMFYWLQILKTTFESKATGTTFKAISVDIVKNECIPLPPLNEQKRIVEKIESLFSIFDQITKNIS